MRCDSLCGLLRAQVEELQQWRREQIKDQRQKAARIIQKHWSVMCSPVGVGGYFVLLCSLRLVCLCLVICCLLLLLFDEMFYLHTNNYSLHACNSPPYCIGLRVWIIVYKFACCLSANVVILTSSCRRCHKSRQNQVTRQLLETCDSCILVHVIGWYQFSSVIWCFVHSFILSTKPNTLYPRLNLILL